MPSLLVIKFLRPLLSELCSQLEGATTFKLLLHYRLVSSGDLSLLFLTLLTAFNWQHLGLEKQSRWLLNFYIGQMCTTRDNSDLFPLLSDRTTLSLIRGWRRCMCAPSQLISESVRINNDQIGRAAPELFSAGPRVQSRLRRTPSVLFMIRPSET